MKRSSAILMLCLTLACVLAFSASALYTGERQAARADVIRSLFFKLKNATATPPPEPVNNHLLEGLTLPEGWRGLPGSNHALVQNMSQDLAQHFQDESAKATEALLGLTGQNGTFVCYVLQVAALDSMELSLFKEKNVDAILETIKGLVLAEAKSLEIPDAKTRLEKVNGSLVVYLNAEGKAGTFLRAAFVFGKEANTLTLLVYTEQEPEGLDSLVEQLSAL